MDRLPLFWIVMKSFAVYKRQFYQYFDLEFYDKFRFGIVKRKNINFSFHLGIILI